MTSKKTIYRLCWFLILLFTAGSAHAQRPMEKLNRSVVAQKVSNDVYVNWRIPSDEWYNTSYKLYRDGALIFETGTKDASNYLDPNGTLSSNYSVASVKNGIESNPSPSVSVLSKNYLEIPVRDLKHLGKTDYYLNDATAADLDGDGEYELIVKRVNNDWSTTNTNFTYFEAYKLNGTFLWAIDVGPNITNDKQIDIAAFDFDGDGKAEVFMRSSDNSIFGLDINNQHGISVADRDNDGVTNYRYSIVKDGYMIEGPEYLSLIDGMTGKEIDWVPFIPRGNSSEWGDDYGHRSNAFFFGAPYLDGLKPSLFIGRGIYTMTKMQTYDIINKKLVKRWYWECTSPDQLIQGKYDEAPKSYFGQGYHNFTSADVDGDGKDEINWGSMAIDDDGLPLYSSELGHGDAQHYGDLDPYRKGIEMFACNESKPGTNMRDAKTGEILFRHITPSDCGRAGCGNVSDAYRGAEIWGGGIGASATDKVKLASSGIPANYCIYWDGDLLQEICDHTGFSNTTGTGWGQISKFNDFNTISALLTTDTYSCNGTKGTPNLQADIMGDWREEVIWWRPDSMALRVYTTPYETTHRIYSLMHDPQYRQAICWQMCAYNQPPHTGFYLGSDFPTPIPAKSTNGKLVWAGTSSIWNNTVPNFMDGNDAVGMIAGTSPRISFAKDKDVLFDTHGTIKNIDLPLDIEPELLMVAGTEDYTIGGKGSLSGQMHLDKLGEAALNLNGTHTYSGATEVWEGSLWLNGTLSNSNVLVRRYANFGGKCSLGNGIITEFNAGLYVGGENSTDTMNVSGSVILAEATNVFFDLSDHPTLSTSGILQTNNQFTNDFLHIDGTLQLADGVVFSIHQTTDSLASGRYLLMKANVLIGNLAKVKIQGSGSKAVELTYDQQSKELFLIVKGTRNATKIKWTGKTDSNWNVSNTTNFERDGFADVFVRNDSVYFDNTANNRMINLVDTLPVSLIDVNSDTNFTFAGSGVLTGSTTLHKAGSGTLIINTRNNYSGKTLVDAGKFIMQYAPTATANGGIGVNSLDPADFVVKDSAVIEVSSANEITDRGLNIAGNGGGILEVNAPLYWNGEVTGTKLTKSGSGILFIGSNNPNLNETVLQSGTLKLNNLTSVPYGTGKKIILLGGTLETINNKSFYLTSNNDFEVPSGHTATITAGARCEYNGSLTGNGNLNWNCDFIRAYINGNWSAFSGKIAINANKANSTSEDHFIVNTILGFPNATINLGNGVRMCYKNNTSDNGTKTIKVGMLTGVAGSEFFNAGLEVGSNNTDGLFAGSISGVTSVQKVGTGLWELSGESSYTGTTTITSGSVLLSGTLSLSPVTISDGATLILTGTIHSTFKNNGTLKGTGTIIGSATLMKNSSTNPGGTSIGTLSFGENVTMEESAVLSLQISGNSSVCDKLVVAGDLTCKGTLDVSLSSGVLNEGSVYTIIRAAKIGETFSTIHLPLLPTGLEWDLSELYASGTIKVIKSTGLTGVFLKGGVVQNPSSGIFRIYSGNNFADYHVSIANLSGKIIDQSFGNNSNKTFEVDLSNEPNGVYLLKLINNNQRSEVFKLIKE